MSNLPREPEFEQALNELSTSLEPFLAANPEYKKALDIVQVPERVLQFRVVWEDDQGQAQVNRGFRVQVRPPSPSNRPYSFSSLFAVQLGPRSLQGRSPPPPLGQPFHPQVLGFRTGSFALPLRWSLAY